MSTTSVDATSTWRTWMRDETKKKKLKKTKRYETKLNAIFVYTFYSNKRNFVKGYTKKLHKKKRKTKTKTQNAKWKFVVSSKNKK